MDEKQLYNPPEEIKGRAHISSKEEYSRLYKQSLENPEAFWGSIAQQFYWKKHWRSPFSRSDAFENLLTLAVMRAIAQPWLCNIAMSCARSSF